MNTPARPASVRRVFSALALDPAVLDDALSVVGFDWSDETRPRGVSLATLEAAVAWLREQPEIAAALAAEQGA